MDHNNIDKLNNFLALGDSYTIGQSVLTDERWPVQLVAEMREAVYSIEDAEIIAQTGWTTFELQNAIESANPVGPYAMVSLLIGVNNQYRGLSITDYRQEFQQLLQKAIAFADNKPQNVIVLSIPDWGVTPFAANRDRTKIADEIDAFNAVNYDESQKNGVRYIDITAISRQAEKEPSLIASDGLHPSAKMYAAWVEIVLPVANELYQQIK